MKHHNYGPSSLGLRSASACYQPNNDSNEHTLRGNVLHEAMENMSDEYVPDEDSWAYYDVVQKLTSLGFLRENGEFEHPGQREKQLTLWDDEDELLFGTADLLLFDNIGREIFLIDYKFGKNRVPDPEMNLQLQAYGAAALQAFPEFESCTTHILQPGQEYEPHTIQSGEVDSIVANISGLIAFCKRVEKSGEIFPSTAGCIYCARFAGCPGPISMAEDFIMNYENLLLTPEGRTKLADMKALMSKLVKDTGVALLPFVEDDEVPGYRLQEVEYKNPKSSIEILEYLDKQGIDISKHQESIKVNISRIANKESLDMENLIQDGLVETITTKQIRKIR